MLCFDKNSIPVNVRKTILLVALLLEVFAPNAWAYDGSVTVASGQTIYYNYNGNNQTVVITCPGDNDWGNYSKPTGTLVIPDSVTHNGVICPVTSIGNSAFYYCTGLIFVTIPNSVTSIGNYAFCHCSSLNYVTIPNGVTSIGNHAFSYNNDMGFVTIPNSVASIGDYAFSRCTDLTSVTIGGDGTAIGNHAFYYCTGLTFAIIDGNEISIGNHAFTQCNGLISATIDGDETSIGNYAFFHCDSLTSVTIGGYGTSIGNNAFNSCNALTSVTIGSGVSSIGMYAFYGCSGLSSVTIPDSVGSIGVCAFYGCSGLTSLTIGSGVTSIGDGAFSDCCALETVFMMPPSPPTLGGNSVFCLNDSMAFFLTGCSYDNYYTTNPDSRWYIYCGMLREPIFDFTVTVLSNDSTRGTATVIAGRGDRLVRCDTTAVISATPNDSCQFIAWSDGNTENPRTLIVTHDTLLTALFVTCVDSDVVVSVTACESYLWQDSTLTTSGDYTYLHTDVNGCIYVDTLHLTINYNDTVFYNRVVCDSLTWYGVTYTDSTYGVHYLTVPGTVGCDSVFFLELTVNHTTYGETSAIACDIYIWDWSEGVYTASGDYVYRDTVNRNSQLCDSVVTLHLTIHNSVASDTSATACDLFTWYGSSYGNSDEIEHIWYGVTSDGCDSIVTLYLTINHSTTTTVTDSAETSYTWNGETYTESGTYIWAGTTAEGCDSTVTLNLTITHNEGIEDVDVRDSGIRVYVEGNRICVSGSVGELVQVFDVTGRSIDEWVVCSGRTTTTALPGGVYFVKIGDHPARRVVVIR